MNQLIFWAKTGLEIAIEKDKDNAMRQKHIPLPIQCEINDKMIKEKVKKKGKRKERKIQRTQDDEQMTNFVSVFP